MTNKWAFQSKANRPANRFKAGRGPQVNKYD